MKLYYFPISGRAEPTRLMLTLAGKEFEDVRVPFTDWPKLKPSAPFGQMPFLELDDGQKLAQQVAIENYVAKLTGFEPEDGLVRARGDEARVLLEDTMQVLIPTFSISDAEEKLAKRKELYAGPVKTKMEQISNVVAALSGKFFGGEKLSPADFAVFTWLSSWGTGFLDGIPADFVKDWPVLKEYRNKVATVEGVKNYYEGDEKATSFQPDP